MEADTDFLWLGDEVSAFNLFEAIGATRQELRHSDFLGYLLDPSQNHGLGDGFSRWFVSGPLASMGDPRWTSATTDRLNMEVAEVRREWRHIDILIHDDANDIIVIVENKIDSSEHSNHLQRYSDIVCHWLEGHS